MCWRLSAGPAGGSSVPHAAVLVSGGRRPRLVSPPDLHPSRPWLRAAGVTGDGPRPRAGPAGGGWPLSLSGTRGGVTEEGSPFPRPVTALLRPAGGTGEPGSSPLPAGHDAHAPRWPFLTFRTFSFQKSLKVFFLQDGLNLNSLDPHEKPEGWTSLRPLEGDSGPEGSTYQGREAGGVCPRTRRTEDRGGQRMAFYRLFPS